MSFVDRTYPDLVRDILTTLTAGVSGEVHRVTVNPDGTLADIRLQRRPVVRVSQVSGYVAVPAGDPVKTVFGLDDYELVPDPADPADVSTVRFLPTGRRPPPDTDVVVNYYPRSADATVIQDVTVGSVARTLVEAVAREISIAYAQLNAAYDSAFVETAGGSSLDRVVALLGYRRHTAGRPVGSVRFSRRAGATGEVTIPAGTPIADAKDTLRYETTETRTMLAGESTAEVRVRGASAATPVVEAGVLTSIQRAIAGIDTVTNETPTSSASQDENDAELRARARAALASAAKGTVGALTNGLLALPQVRAVSVEERPDDVPGEIRISVSLASPPADGSVPDQVTARVEELRPAGIRVRLERAAELALAARVRLVLAGSSVPSVEREQLREAARRKLVDLVARVQVGQRVRVGALQAALVDGERVLDASIALGPTGAAPGTPGADLVPAVGQAVRLAPDGVTFDAEVFDTPAVAPATVPVDVRATVRPVGAGADLTALRSGVTAKLTAYVATLTAGTVVTAEALLAAVRDDAKYALDPLGLVVTFTAGDQFVQVASGGPSFTVTAGQRFTVSSVEVTS
jgi:uncharacterized phage protein gp47/JayE